MPLKISPYSILMVLLAACFTLATLFVPRAAWWNAAPRPAGWHGQSQSDNVFKLLLGEGRRLFGNEMFIMADSYFHSGYYPSIFDRPVTEHDVANPAEGKSEDEHSTEDDFLGPPPDWIAALDRRFVPNRHTHLSSGGPTGHEKAASVQEILPWLKLATDMNPQFINAYRVGAYWLRRLHMPAQARDFLYRGLHNNPGNTALLFDLGWLYAHDLHDVNRASNVWLAGLQCWDAQPPNVKTNLESQKICDELAMNLVRLQEDASNWPQALHYLYIVKQASPEPAAIQKQIDEVKKKITSDR
ncbi:MAG: hypothetical protein KGJ60_15910 [Verrucomicrobiota bacterium]|nr:hypothetical protein [Verrucomicrobiota bacterium]